MQILTTTRLGALLFGALTLAAMTPAAAALQAPKPPTVTIEAPTYFVAGGQFEVELEIQASDTGSTAAAWWLSPSGFLVDGEPVTRREGDALIELAPNAKLELRFDLGPYIRSTEDFSLSFARGAYEGDPIQVQVFEAVPTEGEDAVDFMEAPVEDLGNYLAILETNQGTMVAEFWPDVAPGHVRNYLDLGSSGFYDGVLFHRVIPGFMIQGGDPQTKDATKSSRWGTGNGPRTLKAEFNDRPHEPGVLSMARGGDPNSASCQFFVMHAKYPSLDGQYTAFGKLVSGLEVVDRIVNTETVADPLSRARSRPAEPQRIERVTVVRRRS